MKNRRKSETGGKTLRFAPLAAALLCATAARADHRPEVPTKEALSLLGFGDTFRDCREWSDGCAVCKRTDAVHCSTPGILCQPNVISCTVP